MKERWVNVIGAGLAGLSAALTLAEAGIRVRLISEEVSERAQSVLAEGGINAALDTMGEADSPREHSEDTMRSGAGLSEETAVRALTDAAPEIVEWLAGLGVPFAQADGAYVLRSFGGQRKRRTAYVKSSTGKIVMSALIRECRRWEALGQIQRYSHHIFEWLLLEAGRCGGVRIRDRYTGEESVLGGSVILCSGGLAGMFPGRATGSTADRGSVTARVFSQGVRLSNLEMLQYHPTTAAIAGKRCLISEAARGEGGRLYVLRDGVPWYFMEEKYPELKNLMPRDVVSREMDAVARRADCGGQVYLDMTGLDEAAWREKLPDLREELLHYTGKDPREEPIAVAPGLHYFMGGIEVDAAHRTEHAGLYAAGECCSQYHGANRLGGNSMLGALYGGRRAANSALEETEEGGEAPEEGTPELARADAAGEGFLLELGDILSAGLGIVRTEEELGAALRKLQKLRERTHGREEQAYLFLGEAMLRSAQLRRESRGAHCRADYPETNEAYARQTRALCREDAVEVSL